MEFSLSSAFGYTLEYIYGYLDLAYYLDLREWWQQHPPTWRLGEMFLEYNGVKKSKPAVTRKRSGSAGLFAEQFIGDGGRMRRVAKGYFNDQIASMNWGNDGPPELFKEHANG